MSVYKDEKNGTWRCIYRYTVIPHFIYIQIMLYSVELKAA